jgi:Mrp family chromosome partitioning ATPase
MNESLSTNGAPHATEHLAERDGASATTLRTRSRLAGRGIAKRRGAEPFDALLWRLQSRQAAGDQIATTIGLIGCETGAGVTTIAANLAVRASELRLGPVLLVETNCEQPRLRTAWKLPPGPGLAEMLTGEAAFADCLCDGPAADLHVIPASAAKRRETPAWDPGALDALLAESCADHALVLFDLPSADQLQHAVLLARRLDQVLLVVRAEQSRGPATRRIADQLLDDGVPLAGAVLNRERKYVPRWLSRWI